MKGSAKYLSNEAEGNEGGVGVGELMEEDHAPCQPKGSLSHHPSAIHSLALWTLQAPEGILSVGPEGGLLRGSRKS